MESDTPTRIELRVTVRARPEEHVDRMSQDVLGLREQLRRRYGDELRTASVPESTGTDSDGVWRSGAELAAAGTFLLQALPALPPLLEILKMLRQWGVRSGRRVEVEMPGRGKISVDEPSAEDLHALVQAWIDGVGRT